MMQSGSRRTIAAVAALAVVVVVVLLMPVGVSAQPSYPGSVRNPDFWYYCYGSSVNHSDDTSAGYDPLECEPISWSLGASDEMVFIANMEDPENNGEYIDFRGYILPPQGIESIVYSCTATVEICRPGGLSGSGGATIKTAHNIYYSDGGSGWNVNTGGLGTPGVGACFSDSIDVVSTWESTDYDRWWEVDPYDSWGSSATVEGAYFQVTMSTGNDNRSYSAAYSCQVLDWANWAEWLVDHDPWEPPSVETTPTPTMIYTMTPLLPVSNTVDVGIGDVITTQCNLLLAGYSYSGTVLGQDIDVHWAPFEVCTQERSLSLDWMGIDFGGYLLLAIGMAGVGVFWRVVRNG